MNIEPYVLGLLPRPVMIYPVDWAQGVDETYSWLTDVLISSTGTEQRRCLRTSPRRTIEMTIFLNGGTRTRFDLFMSRAGANDVYLPIWSDGQRLKTPLNYGANTITSVNMNRDFLVGDGVLLLNRDRACVVGTASIGSDSLGLTDTLDEPWPIGTLMYPVRVARFTEQPSMDHLMPSLATSRVRLLIIGTNDRTFDYPEELTVLRGGFDYYTPVFTEPPDQTEAMAAGFVRFMETLDTDTGIPSQVDVGGRAFHTQTHRWFIHGRDRYAAMLDALYRTQGQFKAFWMPTFKDDIQPTRPAQNNQSLIVASTGMEAAQSLYGADRNRILILMRDGTRRYCQVSQATTLSPTEERIDIWPPAPEPLGPHNVLQVCFMVEARLASDTISINHMTDADGVSTLALNIRSTYEDRELQFISGGV